MSPSKPLDRRVPLAILAFGITGGSAFMFVKLLVGELTLLELVAGRVTLGAAPLCLLTLAAGRLPRLSRSLIGGAGLLALLDTVAPYLLVAWSQHHINSSTAALLISTMPLFTTLLAAGSGSDEKIGHTTLAGLGGGFLGVAILAGPGALAVTSSSAIAVFAMTIAAFCYAAGAVYSRGLLRSTDAISLSAVKLGLATCFLLPLALATGGGGGFSRLGIEGWLALVAVGVFSTGIGRCVYQWIIGAAGSVTASLVTYVVPVVALLLGSFVLHEAISAATLAAAGLIIAGIAIVMYGEKLRQLVTKGREAPKTAVSAAVRAR